MEPVQACNIGKSARIVGDCMPYPKIQKRQQMAMRVVCTTKSLCEY